MTKKSRSVHQSFENATLTAEVVPPHNPFKELVSIALSGDIQIKSPKPGKGTSSGSVHMNGWKFGSAGGAKPARIR